MSPLTRHIGLAGLGLLGIVSLSYAGCGGANGSNGRVTAKDASQVARKSSAKEHPVDMFPVLVPQGGSETSTVVKVGTVPITRATYVHWANVLTPKIASYEPKSRSDCSTVRASSEVRASRQEVSKLSSAQIQALCIRQKQGEVRENVLKQLISNQWVISEADELGVGVSEAQAQQEVSRDAAQQFKSRQEFLRYLSEAGRTLADITSEIRAQTAGENLLALVKRKAAARLSEAAIKRYYRAHKHEFEIPETRDIRAIRTWTHTAIANAMAEVRAGKNIADVARRVSIDKPANEHGGLVEGIVKGEEEKGLDEAIFAARLHTLTGPLYLRKRYYAFEVVKITPGQIKSFKETEGKVRETLSRKLQEEERLRFVRAFRMKWLGRTSCAYPYVISRCREWRGPSVLAGEPFELR